MNIKYAIISPVRNEEQFIEKTILSVISQTLRPVEWLIVDDGSSDRTKEIIVKYLDKFNWIKLISREDKGHRAGVGPAEAFNKGLKHITKDFDFLVNLDGDVSFERDYFSKLLQKFIDIPKLGIASGKSYYLENNKLVLYRCADSSTLGASKAYRKECFFDIGGQLEKSVYWDTIDNIKAQMKGWQTRSFSGVEFIHYKMIGLKQGNIIKTQVKSGKIFYFLGYHPLFMIGKGLYRVIDKPYIIGSLAMLYGYFLSWIKREKQIDDKEMIHFLQLRQMEALTFKSFFEKKCKKK